MWHFVMDNNNLLYWLKIIMTSHMISIAQRLSGTKCSYFRLVTTIVGVKKQKNSFLRHSVSLGSGIVHFVLKFS